MWIKQLYYLDKNETSLSTLWISSSVEPFCFTMPLMEHFICSWCGSGISLLCTKTDPKGQNVSILFAVKFIRDLMFKNYHHLNDKTIPINHCPLFLVFCQSLADISWATVYPNTYSYAFSTVMFLHFFPITTANSTSQSSAWKILYDPINNINSRRSTVIHSVLLILMNVSRCHLDQ